MRVAPRCPENDLGECPDPIWAVDARTVFEPRWDDSSPGAGCLPYIRLLFYLLFVVIGLPCGPKKKHSAGFFSVRLAKI